MHFFDSYPINITHKKPLIHCITNAVSINDVANAVIVCGGSPIMATSPHETVEVSQHCQALLINTGMLTDDKCTAIERSIDVCFTNNIPIVLDPVGVTISSYRRQFVLSLLERYTFTVIKANQAELNALLSGTSVHCGLDSLEESSHAAELTKQAATTFNATVLCTSKYDCIVTPSHSAIIKQSAHALTTFTGSGCLLGGMVATYVARFNSPYSACVYGATQLTLAASKVPESLGPLSLKTQLFDELVKPLDINILKEQSEILYE